MTDKHIEETQSHPDHAFTLDIREPEKWQMKVRMFLEGIEDPEEAEKWMEGMRLVTQMSSRLIRDQVYKRVTSRCYVCKGPLREGKPAGEAGYHDADREYIKIYCHDQSEFGDLMKIAMHKEQDVRDAEERAAAAVRKAMIAIRQPNKAKAAAV